MRKSFTRLFGVFILIVMMSLQGFTVPAPTLGPTTDFVNIKKTGKVVLTSTTAVTPGTGVVRLLDASNNPLKTYQATSSNVVISNVKNSAGLYEIQVDFTNYLKEETAFKLEVDNNFVKDATGGNTGFAALNVYVGDFTAPLLKSTDPLAPKNGATVDVQLSQPLEITFNEDVKVADNAKVYIYTDNGTPFGNLFETVSAPELKVKAGDAKTIQIVHNKTFVQSTKYYVTIPAGAIVDNQANAAAPFNSYDNKNAYAGFMSETSWVFTTRDNTEAKFVKKVADNIAKDNFDVIMQLDKAGKVYVLAVPADAAAPTVANFTEANGMKSATVAEANTNFSVNLTHYFNAGALAIVEGGNYDVYAYTENKQNPPNAGEVIKLFSQKTPDVTAPFVKLNTPAKFAVDVKVADIKYLKLDLSEKVVIGTGTVEVWKWDNALNHTLKQTIAAADCKVSLATNPAAKNDTLYIPVAASVWESNVKYFVKYSKAIVKDPSGNELAGISTTEDWKFTVIDFLAPTYTYSAVQTATTSANPKVDLVFDFNEVLYSNAAQTAMTDGVGGTFASALTIKEGSSAIIPTAVVLTNGDKFTVTIPVSSAKTYSVAIDTKKVFDLKGNKGTTVDSYTLNVKDYMAPVVSIKPTTKPDTDLLGKSDNIIISFDEPVFKGDGTAVDNAYVAAHVIFRKGTSASGAFVNATYTVAADAKSFIINPDNDFTNQGDKYYVYLGATTVEDASGNEIVFKEKVLTVDDFVVPTASYKYAAGTAIVAGTPVNPVTLIPYVEFSEPVKALTGNTLIAHGDDAKAYINFKENGENVVYDAKWDLTTDAAKPRINIIYGFQGLKEYTILLGTSVVDVNGNAFAGKSQTFKTFSTVAPTVSGKIPAADATAVKAGDAIEVTFNENVVLAGGGITVIQDPAGAATNLLGTITFSGAVLKIGHTDFTANKVVEVTVPAGAVKNAAGITNAAEIKWKFSTVDTDAPVAVSATSDPKIDTKETNVAVADKLVLGFSEKVVLHNGTIYIRTKSNDVAVQTLTQANAKLDDTGKLLTITPVAALAYNTSYYVEITPGLVKDVEGNSFGGFTSDVWDFATVANPGTFIVKSSVPADQNDKVALGDDFVLTLSWDAKTSTIDAAKTIRLDRNTAAQGAPAVWVNVWDKAVNLAMFTFSGNTITINPDDNLVANTQYQLTVNSGIVEDNYGQELTSYTIQFYTYDNNGPKVIGTVPAKDAEKVAVNSTITINWDETPYYLGSEVTAANIKDLSLVTVNGEAKYTAEVSGKSWILTMDAPFAEKTTYNVVVKQTSVKDSGGKVQGADYSYSFTTVDNTINKPTAFANEVNTAGTEYGFTVNFDEKGSVYYVVAPKADADPTTQDIIENGTKIEFAAAGTSAAQTAKGLASSVEYTFFFVAVDAAGNKSAIYSVDRTTKDVIKPVATISSPVNEATAVAADANLVLTFNEKVKVGTAGSVIIREVGTELIVESIAFNSANITYSDDKLKVTINPSSVLESLNKYYVEVDGAAIVDLAGNSFASILGSDKWSFTVKDTDKPLLVSTTPALADVPEVKKASTYTLEFNESVKAGSGTLVVKYKSNIGSLILAGDEFEVVNVSSMDFSVDKKVSFTLVNVPVEQTDFYVEIPTGLIKDLADNSFDGALKAGGFIGTTWDFIILDQTAPVMTSAKVQKTLGTDVDAANAVGVNIATPIKVTFSEPIYKSPDATAFDNTTIDAIVSVKDAAGVAVELNAANTVIDANKEIITIVPKNNLKSETTYTVTISPVVDKKKNVTSEVSFSFTTKDMTAPVASIVPVHKSTLNPKTGVVTITFNEPIYDEVVLATSENNNVVVPVIDGNIGSFFTFEQVNVKADKSFDSVVKAVKFTGAISADKKVITLTPNADQVPFVSEAWYRVVLIADVVMDGAANKNAATTSIFQVEDIAAPVTAAAANFAPQGPTTATAALTITFNEAVKVGTGNIYVRNYINGEILETIKVDEVGKVTFNDTKKVVTIAHADFAAKTNFYATADAGTFTDLVGNPWIGIKTSDINVWKFSTLDAVEPKILAISGFMPANGSTNVGVGTNLEITFDKQIVKNAGNVIIYNEDWTPFEVVNIQSANVTFKPVTNPVFENNRVLVVNPTADLKGLSKYFVRIESGAVKDNAGNIFTGLLDKSWSFTTEDITAPTVKNLTPKTGDLEVSVKPTLVVEFSVNVEPNAAGKIYLYKEIPGQLGKLIETIDPKSSNVLVDTKFVTITPSATLDYEETYYVIVDAGAFNNTSTNKLPFNGITTTQEWTFTTEADNDKPVVVKAEPNAVNGLKPSEVTLKLTLSEAVVAGTGNIVVFDAKADTIVSTIAIASATIEGGVVTTVPTGLKENMSYYVKVDAGSLLDKATPANAFAGITDKLTWNFETGDFTAPTLVAKNPTADELKDTHPSFKMTFSEEVKLGAGGNLKVYKVGTTEVVLDIPVTAAMINGKVVTVTTSKGLDKSANYFVKVDGSALTDKAGNKFAGISDAAVWTFKTGPVFPTGIDGLTEADFRVYPNPFVGVINIDNASKLSKVVITNIAGQVVKEVVNPDNSIQLNELRTGHYFISLYDMDNVITKTVKIVKR